MLYNVTSIRNFDFETLSAKAYNTTLVLNDLVVVSGSIFASFVLLIVVLAFVSVCFSKSHAVEVIGEDEETVLCSNVKTLKPI